MFWLVITILGYFFLAIVSLFDRYFLVGPVPNPKVYTFYVGILGLFISLIIIPFGINLKEIDIIFFGIFTGLIRILAVLSLSKSIIQSEISRVVPAIGGFLPIFSFFLFLIFFPTSGILNLFQLIAFILLLIGSVLISLKSFSLKFLNFKTLGYPIVTAFLFALNFLLTKNLYLKTNFLSGLFFIFFGGGVGAIILLIFSEVRSAVFVKKMTQKISALFILGQIFGGAGVFLQQYAVFLAKPSQVPLINALEGTRYVFLLFFVILLSFWKSNILQEEVGKKAVLQKVPAILFISIGLAILAFT